MSASPTEIVVIIAEESLLAVDVAHIRSLCPPQTGYGLLVPTGQDRNVVADFLDHLAIFDLKEAWEDLTGQNDVPEDVARADATEVLETSRAALEAEGMEVVRARIADDVMAALREELVSPETVLQIIAVTEQRAVEDTFHTNWADKAQEEFGLPVLHFYRGTSSIGS